MDKSEGVSDRLNRPLICLIQMMKMQLSQNQMHRIDQRSVRMEG